MLIKKSEIEKTKPTYSISGLQKEGSKKQGHCYSKREEAVWPLLFLNNNDPVFLHPAFCTPYFGPDFLKVPDPKKISGRPDNLIIRVQIDWAIFFLKYLDKHL